MFREEEREKEEFHSKEILHISMTFVVIKECQEIHCCSQQNTKYYNNEYLHAFVEVVW
ncbi:MAG: hypothetical protein JO297_18860 [Nitrososphaeraceae archaeon]|nr:hypothetical protein [Nitrososphaeraceae archaeon]